MNKWREEGQDLDKKGERTGMIKKKLGKRNIPRQYYVDVKKEK